jgi:hypothetical protein
MLDERRRNKLKDAAMVAADFLGVDSSTELAGFSESVTGADIEAVQIVLADLIGQVPSSVLRGANPSDIPSWSTIAVGDDQVKAPDYVSAPFSAGVAADFPFYFRTWPKNGGMVRYLHIFVRATDELRAERFLAGLVTSAQSSRSPYRNRVVESAVAAGGYTFRVVPTPTETRESLVLADHVWEAVIRNVDKMFERMDRLVASGLGGNRGLLLAGPPGTGKNALCRALACEFEGRATVVIVSAGVGQWALGQLYERLNVLAPALVLVEDLDLIVGDREEEGATPGLVQFLTVLDGLMTRHSGVVTVATTNDPAAIDEAAVRAARFDQIVHLDLPGHGARAAILDLYLSRLETRPTPTLWPTRLMGSVAPISGKSYEPPCSTPSMR